MAGVLVLGLPLAAPAQEPVERSYSSANFSIVWVEEGPDAPDLTDADTDGIPDGVYRMVQAFEVSRSFLLGDLGYAEPPTDDKYPLYVAQGDGRGYVKPLPADGSSRSSFIVIPPREVRSVLPDTTMKMFAVHEYHHAIQLGYDATEDIWIREATASWVEDVFLDDVNPNHRYLPWFLPFPGRSMVDSGGDHSYGAFLFLQFLMERYGGGDPGIVRELWEEMAVPQAVPGAPDRSSVGAVEEVLRRRGVALEAAWGEFLIWQRRLHHFQEGASYRRVMRGAEWPNISTRSRVADETCRIEVPNGTLPRFSGDYAVFTPAKALVDDMATLTAVGPPRSAGYYLLKPLGAPAVEHPLVFDENGVATATTRFDRSSIRRVSIGVGHVGTRAGTVAYSVRVAGRPDVTGGFSAPSEITYLDGAWLSGSVYCGGEAAPFAKVVLKATEAASGIQTVHQLRTGETGSFRLRIAPEVNTVYSGSVEDPLLSQLTFSDRLVQVRLFVTLDVPDRAVNGRVARISGTADPVHPGAEVQVEFRRPERDWRQGPSTTLSPNGTYEVDVTFPRAGVWEVRTHIAPADADHAVGTSVPGFVRLL